MLYEGQIFPFPAILITEQERAGLDNHKPEM